MSNNSIDSSQAADQLLLALGEQLAARGESYTLAVVGGSALLALGLISRPTRDVDILAIVDLGLPNGFYERTQRRIYGPDLEILFASRVDQIHLKLYATVDQGAGKHLKDLEALQPTHQELLDAAHWSRSHDPSEGYLSVLKQVLTHFGVDSGNLDP
jgi:hypothetical protein